MTAPELAEGGPAPTTEALWDLTGRRVLSVGGTRGIGLAAAAALARLGADLVLAGRDRTRAVDAAQQVRGSLARTVDATDAAALSALLDEVVPTDVVLSTSAAMNVALAELDVDEAGRWVRERVTPLLAVAGWAARRPASLRSISVVSGFVLRRGVPGLALWAFMGPGVVGLVEQLAVELAPTRVNAVGPGYVVDSPRALEHYAGGDAERAARTRDEIAATSPARHAITLDDVSRQIVQLVVDPALTGTFRTVDTGASLR